MKQIIFFIVISCLLLLIVYHLGWFNRTQGYAQSDSSLDELWPYRCIDTMKTSRDQARNWANWSGLENEITTEMKDIAGTGANCVAIDTPYDSEFLPYLTKWVTAARADNLHVLFRGNFSSWEGWFNYPKNMNSTELLQKTASFIESNPNLFQDGDIFVAAPEAEDGGEFNQVEPNQYGVYRTFLIHEYQMENNAFQKIGKKVVTNWLSMNGGLAKRMFDQSTINSLGKTVTIDHYIANPASMGNYISYFHNTFGANVAIGEFGAPIPDINGDMNESEQAAFVDKLLNQMYINRSSVAGVNYWDLYDGSTALFNPDHTARPVISVIKNYFEPAVIEGKVTDTLENTLPGIHIKTNDEVYDIKTDENGMFNLVVPGGKTITVKTLENQYKNSQILVKTISGNTEMIHFILQPQSPSLLYKVRLKLKQFSL